MRTKTKWMTSIWLFVIAVCLAFVGFYTVTPLKATNSANAATETIVYDLIDISGGQTEMTASTGGGTSFGVLPDGADGVKMKLTVPETMSFNSTKIGFFNTVENNIWEGGVDFMLLRETSGGGIELRYMVGDSQKLDKGAVSITGNTFELEVYHTATNLVINIDGAEYYNKAVSYHETITFGSYFGIYNGSGNTITASTTKVQYVDFAEITANGEKEIAAATGGGTAFGVLPDSARGVQMKLTVPETMSFNSTKIGFFNTVENNIWEGGVDFMFLRETAGGGIELRYMAGDSQKIDQGVVSITGNSFVLTVYREAGNLVILIDGVEYYNKAVGYHETITFGNHFGIYNGSGNTITASTTIVEEPEIVNVVDFAQLGNSKVSAPTGGGTSFGVLPDGADGVQMKLTVPETMSFNSTKIGFFNTSENNIWADGVDFMLLRETAGGGIELRYMAGDSQKIDKGAVSITGNTFELEVYHTATNLVINIDGVEYYNKAVGYHETITFGSYFGVYNGSGNTITASTTIVEEPEIVNVVDFAQLGNKSVLAPTGGGTSFGVLPDGADGVKMKLTVPETMSFGSTKIGFFNTAENNVWADGVDFMLLRETAGGGIELRYMAGDSQKLDKGAVSITGNTFELEVYHTATNLVINIDGVEYYNKAVGYHETITFGNYFGIYNGSGNTITASTTDNYTFDTETVFDYGTIYGENTADRTAAKATTTYIGGGINVNQGIKYNMYFNEGHTGVIKLGAFKSAGTNVWGGATDGYIIMFNVGAKTLALTDGNEGSLVSAVSISDAWSSGTTVKLEISAVKAYKNGVEYGHKLIVKLNDMEKLVYEHTAGTILLGGEFNLYNDTGAAFMIGSTMLSIAVEINGEGNVSGNTDLTEGGTATLTFTAADGYYLDVVSVDGEEVQLDGNQLVIENVQKGMQVIVVFAEDSYTYDSYEVEDVTVFFEEGISKSIEAAAGTYVIGAFDQDGTVISNRALRYRVVLPDSASGTVKFGMFKHYGSQVWGGATDGYIVEYNVGSGTMRLANGDNVYLQEAVNVGTAKNFLLEVGTYNAYKNGEACGYVLYVKIDGALKINYLHTEGTITTYSVFNLYNETSSAFTIETGKNKITLVIGEETQTVTRDYAYVLPVATKVEGQTFLGWKDENGNVYPAGHALDTSATLTATYITFAMRDGAAVRTNLESAGIRFLADVSDTDYNAETNTLSGLTVVQMGILLYPTSSLGNKMITVNLAEVVNFLAEEGSIYVDEKSGKSGYHTYAAALTGIPGAQYNRALSARGYILVEYSNGVQEYIYTNYSEENNSRSIYEVAKKAYNNNERPNAVLNYVNSVADITIDASNNVTKVGVGCYTVNSSVDNGTVTLTFDKAMVALLINGVRIKANQTVTVLAESNLNALNYSLSADGKTITFDMKALTQLGTPNLQKGDGYTITWAAVENADYYVVTDSNASTKSFETTETSYTPFAVGAHEISVTAYSNNTETYTYSAKASINSIEIKPVWAYQSIQRGEFWMTEAQIKSTFGNSASVSGLNTNSKGYYQVWTTVDADYNVDGFTNNANAVNTVNTKLANDTVYMAHRISKLKALGLNVILLEHTGGTWFNTDTTWEGSKLQLFMDEAWKQDMKVIVRDEVLHAASSNNLGTGSWTQENINSTVASHLSGEAANYINHSAFYGFTLQDEPVDGVLNYMGWTAKAARTAVQALRGADFEPLMQAGLTIAYSQSFTSVDEYSTHIKKWIDNTGCNYIAFNLYTDNTTWNGSTYPDRYPATYEAIQNVIDEYSANGAKIELYQTLTAFNENASVTGNAANALTDVDVYMSMLYAAAHGAAGYSWFNYYPVVEAAEQFKNTIVGYKGENTATATWVKNANAQFVTLQGLLDGYEYQGRSVGDSVSVKMNWLGTKKFTYYRSVTTQFETVEGKKATMKVNAVTLQNVYKYGGTQSLTTTVTYSVTAGNTYYVFGANGVKAYTATAAATITLQMGEAIVEFKA